MTAVATPELEFYQPVLREEVIDWLRNRKMPFFLRSSEPDPNGKIFTARSNHAHLYCNTDSCVVVLKKPEHAVRFKLRWV